MATIITVHGTKASGPEKGDHWWQIGSPFERALRGWVAATTGEITIKPLIWDGRNSEASRFDAGSRLAGLIEGLENDGEPYCLVGHSHGGSVIAHALVRVSCSRSHLRHLRRWITVGTPFIETRRLLLLFSRLDIPGVAAYLIFAYLSLLWLAFVMSSVSLVVGAELRNPVFDVLIVLLGAAFLGLVYSALHRLQPEKLRLIRRASIMEIGDRLGRTWLALWHRDDEAIQGLKLLKDLRIEPFDRHFASPVLAFGSLLLLPLLMYGLSYFDQYQQLAGLIRLWEPAFNPAADCPDQPGLGGLIPDNNECADVFKQFARNNLAVVAYPARLLHELLAMAGLRPNGSSFNALVLVVLLATGIVIGFATFWLVGMLIHRGVLAAAGQVSAAVSAMLNRFTRTQAVRLGFGCDTIGERANGALEYPPWLVAPCPPLPAELESEITQASNDAAAAAIGKLRSALGVIAFSEGDYKPADLVSRYLTWRELVHTNYLHSERVQKLIAYAITQEEGFRPTSAFVHDADYPVIAGWHGELVGGSKAAV